MGWVIAGAENDDSCLWELLQKTLEIAVRRDQDEAVGGGVFQNPAITGAGKTVLERAFRPRE